MYLFNQINAQTDVNYYLKVSYLEVYNEKARFAFFLKFLSKEVKMKAF